MQRPTVPLMHRLFEELDYRETPIGELSLRRRRELRLDVDVLQNFRIRESGLMATED